MNHQEAWNIVRHAQMINIVGQRTNLKNIQQSQWWVAVIESIKSRTIAGVHEVNQGIVSSAYQKIESTRI